MTSMPSNIDIYIQYFGSPPRDGRPDKMESFLSVKFNEASEILARHNATLDMNTLSVDGRSVKASVAANNLQNLSDELKTHQFLVHQSGPKNCCS